MDGQILQLEQAQSLLLERVEAIRETERISTWDVVNRVLAKDIFAGHDQPPFPRSPLDGYALRSGDIKGATKERPVRLRVMDEVNAGHVSRAFVKQGSAVRIMTGAPIPDGADCVIGQEDTDYGEETVEIYRAVEAYGNYCHAGEDYQAGAKLLERNCVLGPVEAGVLASLGREEVLVYRRPRVSVLTTGDEIVLPGQPLGKGQVYDSNLYTLVTRLRSLGMDVSWGERVEDDPKEAAERIREAGKSADILVTTGGVSVGKKDIMHEVLQLLECERIFWRMAVKPGMPTLCAQYRGTLLICLSGNPFGAAVTIELLVRPLLAKLSGRRDLELKRIQAVSVSDFPKRSVVTRYVRACYEDGRVRIPKGSNASGILSSMCGCNCLIEIPAGTPKVEKGDRVWIVLL
nr:gephyrin-like molybdotransferase Glp [uncultured Schaedlerella sp.]